MSEASVADCIFCRIIAGEIPATVVAENEQAIAIRDLQPQAPTHVLVLPRKHVPALQALTPADDALAAGALALAVEVARRENLLGSGYRVLTNDGADAGQTVAHLHFHVLGGRPMPGGLA